MMGSGEPGLNSTNNSETLGLEENLVIQNRRGLHARASAKFVTTVSEYEADVRVAKDGVEVSGKSIMGLMMLAAAPGDEITVRASGPAAGDAMAALKALISDKFGED
jgi:phosphocarrier protein